MLSVHGPTVNISSFKLMTTFNSLCKDVLKERNRNGDTPLILAIKNRSNVEVIQMFASAALGTSSVQRLFAQRDGTNNNPLHVALRLDPQVDPNVVRTIINIAPFTASQPDNRNKMPIRYVLRLFLSEGC